uniref:Uncharacterized protein n=1 Tax=Arundo donax TaxID=35708 RepID=A0A0A9BLY3_ARUDO
MAVFLICAHKL